MNITPMIGLSLVLSVVGCASNGNHANESNEQMLTAAGFHLYSPKNPQEEANLKAMTQRKVFFMDKAVKPTYLYADDAECDCVYVGGQAEFERFEKLVQQKQAADAVMYQAQYNQSMYGMGGMYGGMYGMGGMGMYPMGMYGMGGSGVMGGYW